MTLVFMLVLLSSQTLADRHVGTVTERELKCKVRREPTNAYRIHTKSCKNRSNDSKCITEADIQMDVTSTIEYERGIKHHFTSKHYSTECA
jgi:hypothetical protein